MKRDNFADVVIRWTVHPDDQGRVMHLAGKRVDDGQIPREGAVIMKPFLVDPNTQHEVPLRVVQVLRFFQELPPVISILVKRAA